MPKIPVVRVQTVTERLRVLINETKIARFTPEYRSQVSDAAALGLMIAHLFEHDVLPIFDTMYAAFEDANYHTFNKNMKESWEAQVADDESFLEGLADTHS